MIGFVFMLSLLLFHLLLALFGIKKKVGSRYLLVITAVPCLLFLIYIARTFSPAYPLFLPPLIIYAGLFYLFARTIMPGRVPLITAISKMMHGELIPELRSYTRNLTILWSAVFLIFFVQSVILAIYTPIEVWSLFTNILNYLFMLGLIIGEYIFRVYYLPDIKHKSPVEVLSFVVSQGRDLAISKKPGNPTVL